MELKLYSREWCSWCIDAKDYLSGRAWHSDLVVSGDLFHHRQLDPGYDRGAELALSAVAGNPYPHTDATVAEGKTASAKEPTVLRHFSEPERNHARDRERGFRARERRRLGLGGLPAVFSIVLQGRRPRSGHYLPERAARSLVLLPAHFVAREKRDDLDDLELSAFLRVEIDAAVSHQSSAT